MYLWWEWWCTCGGSGGVLVVGVVVYLWWEWWCTCGGSGGVLVVGVVVYLWWEWWCTCGGSGGACGCCPTTCMHFHHYYCRPGLFTGIDLECLHASIIHDGVYIQYSANCYINFSMYSSWHVVQLYEVILYKILYKT